MTVKTPETIQWLGHDLTVTASCKESARGGRFYCASCERDGLGGGIGMENVLPKHDGHDVVWFCATHGPEAP